MFLREQSISACEGGPSGASRPPSQARPVGDVRFSPGFRGIFWGAGSRSPSRRRFRIEPRPFRNAIVPVVEGTGATLRRALPSPCGFHGCIWGRSSSFARNLIVRRGKSTPCRRGWPISTPSLREQRSPCSPLGVFWNATFRHSAVGFHSDYRPEEWSVTPRESAQCRTADCSKAPTMRPTSFLHDASNNWRTAPPKSCIAHHLTCVDRRLLGSFLTQR